MSFSYNYFYISGLEYYLAARFANLNNCNSVSPILFHHAVEYCLKGSLSETMSEQDIKNKYGHSLCRLWIAFKDKYDDRTLDLYDSIVRDLDEFEEIRYPKEGKQYAVLSRGSVNPEMPLPFKVYNFDRKDIDSLVTRIFEVSKPHVELIVEIMFRNKGVKEAYEKDNDNPFLSNLEHSH